MLTSGELTDMRAAVYDLMPSQCNILSPTRVSDGAGGNPETWGTATANVSCRIDKASGSEGYVGASRQPFAGYILTLPYDTVILTTYRVEMGANTYAVISDNGDQSDLIVKRVLVESV